MKLNKYLVGVAMAGALVGMPSCAESFLEEVQTTAYDTDYFNTPEGLEQLTISLYGNIRWHFGYEWAYGITLYGTDEFTMGNDNTSEPWNTYNNNLSPLNYTKEVGAPNGNCPPVDALWNQMYYGIATCNTIISKADKVLSDEATKKWCLATAYFLRGYNYYRLTAQYGHCAIQTDAIEGVVRNYADATPEECWEQSISDLRKAYELFDGEDERFGKGVTWNKSTAAHWLAKALLFRVSERNDSWNEKYKSADIEEAIKMCDYAIAQHPLVDNYSDLFANYTGVNCPIESSSEIIMASPSNSQSNTKGRYGNRSDTYFHSQFSNYGGGWVARGFVTGGKDFQRCVPTEYTYGIFDHVADARMWKTFRTVMGANADKNVAVQPQQIALGDPAIVFILNKKNDNTYDKFQFGCPAMVEYEDDVIKDSLKVYDPANYKYYPNFTDDAGRLPAWHKGESTPTEGHFTDKKGQWVPVAGILYQNGEWVRDNFKSLPRCNMYAHINKTTSGNLGADNSDESYRDVTMSRSGETYLMRAELKVRKGDYAGAMEDINVIRKRASWKAGENRSYYTDGSEAARTQAGANVEKLDQTLLNINTYYLSNPELEWTTAASDLQLTTFPANLPAEDEAVLSALGVSGNYERALHFILNERTRELLGEWQRWETLSRTNTLILRAKAYNPDATNIQAGKSELRPIPQTFIDQLKNADGSNLSDSEKKAWQNPGY
ncbi:MAG: RagB/SusD family nutrient uptake outer membrane protein [Muribaculaceae bacterium]|nr:RagB/SusD family nutrient uptake outer membrane protein [Muribaculaceae bacterium]